MTDYLNALKQRKKALDLPKDEFIHDSVIQRFEFTHGLSWKMINY